MKKSERRSSTILIKAKEQNLDSNTRMKKKKEQQLILQKQTSEWLSATMMCKKDEKCRWKISSYHERNENWDAKPYEKIEKTLFRWEIIVRIISSSGIFCTRSDAFADDENFSSDEELIRLMKWFSEELISLAVDDA